MGIRLHYRPVMPVAVFGLEVPGVPGVELSDVPVVDPVPEVPFDRDGPFGVPLPDVPRLFMVPDVPGRDVLPGAFVVPGAVVVPGVPEPGIVVVPGVVMLPGAPAPGVAGAPGAPGDPAPPACASTSEHAITSPPAVRSSTAKLLFIVGLHSGPVLPPQGLNAGGLPVYANVRHYKRRSVFLDSDLNRRNYCSASMAVFVSRSILSTASWVRLFPHQPKPSGVVRESVILSS